MRCFGWSNHISHTQWRDKRYLNRLLVCSSLRTRAVVTSGNLSRRLAAQCLREVMFIGSWLGSSYVQLPVCVEVEHHVSCFEEQYITLFIGIKFNAITKISLQRRCVDAVLQKNPLVPGWKSNSASASQ